MNANQRLQAKKINIKVWSKMGHGWEATTTARVPGKGLEDAPAYIAREIEREDLTGVFTSFLDDIKLSRDLGYPLNVGRIEVNDTGWSFMQVMGLLERTFRRRNPYGHKALLARYEADLYPYQDLAGGTLVKVLDIGLAVGYLKIYGQLDSHDRQAFLGLVGSVQEYAAGTYYVYFDHITTGTISQSVRFLREQLEPIEEAAAAATATAAAATATAQINQVLGLDTRDHAAHDADLDIDAEGGDLDEPLPTEPVEDDPDAELTNAQYEAKYGPEWWQGSPEQAASEAPSETPTEPLAPSEEPIPLPEYDGPTITEQTAQGLLKSFDGNRVVAVASVWGSGMMLTLRDGQVLHYELTDIEMQKAPPESYIIRRLRVEQQAERQANAIMSGIL